VVWTYKRQPKKKKSRVPVPHAEDVIGFVTELLRFEPDERQRELLESVAKRGILNCSRQWGKSTVAAIKAVHRAYSRPRSVVLVASPSERQSAEFIRKASGMVVKLGFAPRGDGDNAISLLFPNGSRIVGLPSTEGTVRGFSAVSLLLIDEAARVEDAAYKALRPSLAVGDGDLWLMSTPYGKRGFFYETWEHGSADWKRVSVAATECPRIPASFLEEERSELGALWFQQEYLCEFVDNGTEVFGRALVEEALDDDLEPLLDHGGDTK
jgi:Terminase large subunit, T4likevirus-type, N-terminal